MVDIRFELDNKRAAAYDGDKLIGESSISPSPTLWIIDHTEVDGNYRGQGIANQLVKAVADAAREHKVKIMPLCPFAKKEFERVKEYQDLL